MGKKTKLYVSGICALTVILIALFAVNPFSGPNFRIIKETSEPITYHYEHIYPNWDIEYDFRIKEIAINDYGIYEEDLEKYICYQALKYLENESEKVYIQGAGFNEYDGISVGSCNYYLAHIEEGVINISYEGYLNDVSYDYSDYTNNYSSDNIEFINNTIYNHNKFHGVSLDVTFYKSEIKEEEVDEIKVQRDDLGSVFLASLSGNTPYPKLDIEWLEEHCECSEVYDYDKKENTLCGENETYLCTAFTNRPDYFKCSEYKCSSNVGNYSVGVLKW